MEKNRVVLKLVEYMNLIKEIEKLKVKANDIDYNFNQLIRYIKDNIGNNENYHLKNIIQDKDFNVENSITKKLNNYHYRELFDMVCKYGITIDLVQQIIDEMINEYVEKGE